MQLVKSVKLVLLVKLVELVCLVQLVKLVKSVKLVELVKLVQLVQLVMLQGVTDKNLPLEVSQKKTHFLNHVHMSKIMFASAGLFSSPITHQ